ncbi:50S ribosomal protein L6 [Candidatus Dojkabacteria bacterium]|uniref:Large ribosomal subunit protein uL6 n=1 Tax=Candidatus Dojkabacteria bacterium TaxID=2099670 RepID=A0A3M0Z1B5_9BACT|nr:MAG: 50S ribosomal protein L6 [Candidatus Dojkabacteria bacterium]
MSRIGRIPVKLPEGVNVEITKGPLCSVVKVSGRLGTLSQQIPNVINVELVESDEGRKIVFSLNELTKRAKSFYGLYRSLVNNMVIGVSQGYFKELEIHGIGYRVEKKGDECVFSLGLSHKIVYVPPQGINVEVSDQVNIKVSGIDKQLVGEVASKIRSFKKPEPYKGKGIRYKGEIVRKKSTKTAK